MCFKICNKRQKRKTGGYKRNMGEGREIFMTLFIKHLLWKLFSRSEILFIFSIKHVLKESPNAIWNYPWSEFSDFIVWLSMRNILQTGLLPFSYAIGYPRHIKLVLYYSYSIFIVYIHNNKLISPPCFVRGFKKDSHIQSKNKEREREKDSHIN
jgi:hypothetical protein